MAERKVLNKYYPADFDPSKIVRRKLGGDRQQTVRLMAPFSMRCNSCGEYIYKGKKFNARKETVNGEEYYGIKIFRFYIKCTQCSAEITFKTDPKNTDYLAEHGATRNFEPWRDDNEATQEDRLNRLEEEENNPMAALENKSIDSKREMEILDGLQELRSRNARIELAGKITGAGGLEEQKIERKVAQLVEKNKLEEEMDEVEIAKIFGRSFIGGVPDIELEIGMESDSSVGSSSSNGSSSKGPTTNSIKRKLDSVEPTPMELLSMNSKSILKKESMAPPKKKKGKNDLANKLGIRLKK